MHRLVGVICGLAVLGSASAPWAQGLPEAVGEAPAVEVPEGLGEPPPEAAFSLMQGKGIG